MDENLNYLRQHELAEYFRRGKVHKVLVSKTATKDRWRIEFGVEQSNVLVLCGLQLKSGGEREFRTLETVQGLIEELGGDAFTVSF